MPASTFHAISVASLSRGGTFGRHALVFLLALVVPGRAVVAADAQPVAPALASTTTVPVPTAQTANAAEQESDEFALLQGNVAILAKAAAAKDASAPSHVVTVPLRKQYVPISRNGKVIAYKTSYFGEIQAGSPNRQTFTVVFDTGSGHLILPNMGCESVTCTKHRRYSRVASQSAVDIEHDGTPIPPNAQSRDQLAIQFGTGEVSGEFVRDVICMGRPNAEVCTETRVVLANKMTEEPFGLFEFDGVLGLGLDALVLSKEFSLFGQMVAQNPQMQPYFAVFLARYDSGHSAISFGGYDESWADSKLDWEPVAMQELGYWQVQIKAVRIGDTLLEDCAAGGCRAILDTGTSLLGVPRQASRTMHRMLARPVPGDHDSPERTSVDCREVPGSYIHFDMESGAVVSLAVEDYSRPQPFNMTVPEAKDGWELFCRSLLLPVDMKPPLGPLVFIWGEPVLRKYLTVYDWASKRIGFSVAGPGTENEDGTASAIGSPPEGSLAAGVPLGASKESNATAAVGAPPPGSLAAGAPLQRRPAPTPAAREAASPMVADAAGAPAVASAGPRGSSSTAVAAAAEALDRQPAAPTTLVSV